MNSLVDSGTGSRAYAGEERIKALLGSRSALIAYLRSKTESEDWHAVQDAASDIREIDAKLSVLRG